MRRGATGQRRRKELVRILMSSKVRSALEMKETARRKVLKLEDYIRRRWGHHTAAIRDFRILMQEEVRRVWTELREKHRVKLDFLEKKWV